MAPFVGRTASTRNPALGADAGRDLATDHSRPFPHPGQPVPAAAIWRRAGAVVVHPHGEVIAAVVKLDVDGRARRVAAGVCQRLLHDAVGRQLDPAVERFDRAAHDQAYATARGRVAYLVEEGVELAEPGLGTEGRLGVHVLSKDAQQTPHLRQRGTRGVPDGSQPTSPVRWQARCREPGRLSLQGDHRNVVRHHVVQFPGDAGSFAAGGVLHQRRGGQLFGGPVAAPLVPQLQRRPDSRRQRRDR